jgi:hypothetical protein
MCNHRGPAANPSEEPEMLGGFIRRLVKGERGSIPIDSLLAVAAGVIFVVLIIAFIGSGSTQTELTAGSVSLTQWEFLGTLVFLLVVLAAGWRIIATSSTETISRFKLLGGWIASLVATYLAARHAK